MMMKLSILFKWKHYSGYCICDINTANKAEREKGFAGILDGCTRNILAELFSFHSECNEKDTKKDDRICLH